MKHSLPCLTALVFVTAVTTVAAQGPDRSGVAEFARIQPTQASPAPPVAAGDATWRAEPLQVQLPNDQRPTSAGDRLLLQTLAQLERHKSITARLHHQLSLDGRERYGVGTYWQQGSGEDLRVRLELQTSGQRASLLQVSNGRFLWTDQRLPSGRVVTRIDMRKLRGDPALVSTEVEELQPGHATWSAIEPEAAGVCGGLPTLISSLVEHFQFAPPQAMRLSVAPPLAEKLTTIPVFVVVGHWRPEKLAALLGEKAVTADSLAGEVPERFPQEVLLAVGQTDLFPYRIEYHRLPEQSQADAAQDKPYELSATPAVVMALTDVAFDVPIAAGQFDYAPGDADWADRTAELRERLLKQRQEPLAGRVSAEAVSR
jgi:hypothetical protein